MTKAEAIARINARQNAANHFTNIGPAEIDAEMRGYIITASRPTEHPADIVYTLEINGATYQAIDTEGAPIIEGDEYSAADVDFYALSAAAQCAHITERVELNQISSEEIRDYYTEIIAEDAAN